MVLLIIFHKIFRLKDVDGERIICPKPIAMEMEWNTSFQTV
jgi:hypothetical protein